MAKFNIQKNSMKLIDGNKVGVVVVFKADDGRSISCYHEIESLDKDVIEEQLQKAANEFETRSTKVITPPVLTTNTDLSVVIKSDAEKVVVK